MRHTVILAAIAALAVANTQPQDPPMLIEIDEYLAYDRNTTVDKRDQVPGWIECKQTGFKKPCIHTETGGNGALDCHQLMYRNRGLNPHMSFQPDRGVTCRFYDTVDCGVFNKPMNLEYPGGDLVALGKAANTWDDREVVGFSSFRCRSWQQKKNDEAQSKYIKLPAQP